MRPRKRILLIDANEEQHFDWSVPLDTNGYRVTTATSAHAARERLKILEANGSDPLIALVVTKSPVEQDVLALARRLHAPVMVLVPAGPRIDAMDAVKKLVRSFRGPEPAAPKEQVA